MQRKSSDGKTQSSTGQSTDESELVTDRLVISPEGVNAKGGQAEPQAGTPPAKRLLINDVFLSPQVFEDLRSAVLAAGAPFDLSDSKGMKLARSYLAFVRKFIAGMDASVIYRLYTLKDRQIALDTIAADFRQGYINHVGVSRSFPSIGYTAEKERTFAPLLSVTILILTNIGSMQSLLQRDCPGFPLQIVYQICRDVTSLAGEEQERREKDQREQIELEYAADLQANVSPTRDREDNTRSTSTEKARIVMNGLRVRNRTGELHVVTRKGSDGLPRLVGERVMMLIFQNRDSSLLVELFDSFPALSPATVLDMIGYCVQIEMDSMTYKDVDKPQVHHAKDGRILRYFCAHMEDIATDLDLRFGTRFQDHFCE